MSALIIAPVVRRASRLKTTGFLAVLCFSLIGPPPATATPSTPGWQWRNPLPHGSGLWQLVESDGRLIATGRAGTIQTTEDGLTWVQRSSGTRDHLRSAAAHGLTVVAVGATGSITTSQDGGLTWALTLADPTRQWAKVIHASDQWVAVGSGIATSPDGLVWTGQTPPQPGFWYTNVVWTGTRLFASGINISGNDPPHAVFHSTDGRLWQKTNLELSANTQVQAMVWTGASMLVSTGREIHSSANGLDWSLSTSLAPGWAQQLIWTGTRVFAFSNDGGDGWVSPSGETWSPSTLATVAPNVRITTLAAHGAEVMAGGAHGEIIVSKDDGDTWEAKSCGVPASIHALHKIANRWLAVGSDGLVASSLDGSVWEPQSSGMRDHLLSLAWHDGLWVAGGSSQASPLRQKVEYTIHTSTDGRNWIDRSFTTPGFDGWNPEIYNIIHHGSEWKAFAANAILTSRDGVQWEAQKTLMSSRATAWNGSRLVMVDRPPEDDPTLVRISDDGGRSWSILWEIRDSVFTTTWSGQEFLVLAAGSLYSSKTGDVGSWQRSTLPPSMFPQAIYADAEATVLGGAKWSPVAGQRATVLVSRNDSAWVECEMPSLGMVSSVRRAGSLFIATVDDGEVLTSGDGIVWTPLTTPTTHELHASGWNGQELLVVGEDGTILAHPSPTAIVPWTGISRPPGQNGTVSLMWASVPGRTYRLESTSGLRPPWESLPAWPRTATAEEEVVEVDPSDFPNSPDRFFRVLQQP